MFDDTSFSAHNRLPAIWPFSAAWRRKVPALSRSYIPGGGVFFFVLKQFISQVRDGKNCDAYAASLSSFVVVLR